MIMIEILKDSEIESFCDRMHSRAPEATIEVRDAVTQILSDVRANRDAAVLEYTAQFDKVDLRSVGMQVSIQEIADANALISYDMLRIVKRAAENIRDFHNKIKPQSWLNWELDGVVLGQKVSPLERVGLYVPGGRAVYPSSLLMTAIPAQVAGVEEIVIVSPPDVRGHIHPSILATAAMLGVDEIYKVGGAQAIAALAYGTDTIAKVDKIVGPGNLYVAEAKRQVFGIVGIDMIAGPSEVVVLADSSANPAFVAADLLAQAEHDPAASAVCVTPDVNLAEQIQSSLFEQAEGLKRGHIFEKSLQEWGAILVPASMDEAVALVNELAAEHLGLHVADPWEILKSIRHAGAIFLGHYSPESVGDYWAGPNHVLPTNRTARFASPLGTGDFVKHSSIINYPRDTLAKDSDAIMQFALMEELDAHANAVKRRLD